MIEPPDTPLHTYRMSGLNVRSTLVLPMRADSGELHAEKADVTMLVEDVPEHLDGVLHSGPNWEINKNSFLLNLPDTGRFMATDGDRISICPAPDMPVEDVLVFATGTGMSAILYQRGAMLLHASAVACNGRAYLFCGPSGVGKSTLSAALCRAGCDFLSDDLCAVVQQVGGPPMVERDGRALRLYTDSIERLALEDSAGPRVRQLVEKFHVAPPTTSDGGGAVPVAAIYMLTASDPAQDPTITRMTPLNAAQALLRQSYRRQIALAYASETGLAGRIGALAAGTGVYHLSRPRDLERLDDSTGELMKHWQSLSLA